MTFENEQPQSPQESEGRKDPKRRKKRKCSSWQEQALEDLRVGKLSYKEIGDKYGRARATVVKLATLHKLTGGRVQRPGPKNLNDLTHISHEHRTLGTRILIYAGANPGVDLLEVLRISPVHYNHLIAGAYDIPLSKLLILSELLGESINEMLTPYRTTIRQGKGNA